MDNYNYLDEMLDLLEGRRKPASDLPKADFKPQPVTQIESTPLEISNPPIQRFEETPSTPLGEFSRKNYNLVIDDNMATREKIDKGYDKAVENRESSRDMLAKAAALQLARADEEPTDSTKLLELYNKQGQSAAAEPDMVTSLINAFGPGLLGMATGGYAGYDAAAATQKYADQAQGKELDRVAKLRAAQELGAGKKLEGISSLAKQELEVEKFKNEKLKNATDNLKYLYDKGIVNEQQFRDGLINLQKEVSGSNIKGIDKTIDVENKAMDRNTDIEKAKIGAEATKARARIGVSKPTEGMYNNAATYSTLTQAEKQYEKFVADNGGVPPSVKTKLYDTFKSLSESSGGITLMGEILKTVPNSNVKRQIELELAWLAPYLRRKSGAAISVGEYIQEGNKFFPRSGNTAEDFALKKARRMQDIENFKSGSGSAPIPKIIETQYPVEQKKQGSSLGQTKVIGGKTYIYKDGAWQLQ